MSKEFYLSLPEHIQLQLHIGDEERQRMGLYVWGGPLTPASRRRRTMTRKRLFGC
jgi:hypothetical protein